MTFAFIVSLTFGLVSALLTLAIGGWMWREAARADSFLWTLRLAQAVQGLWGRAGAARVVGNTGVLLAVWSGVRLCAVVYIFGALLISGGSSASDSTAASTAARARQGAVAAQQAMADGALAGAESAAESAADPSMDALPGEVLPAEALPAEVLPAEARLAEAWPVAVVASPSAPPASGSEPLAPSDAAAGAPR